MKINLNRNTNKSYNNVGHLEISRDLKITIEVNDSNADEFLLSEKIIHMVDNFIKTHNPEKSSLLARMIKMIWRK